MKCLKTYINKNKQINKQTRSVDFPDLKLNWRMLMARTIHFFFFFKDSFRCVLTFRSNKAAKELCRTLVDANDVIVWRPGTGRAAEWKLENRNKMASSADHGLRKVVWKSKFIPGEKVCRCCKQRHAALKSFEAAPIILSSYEVLSVLQCCIWKLDWPNISFVLWSVAEVGKVKLLWCFSHRKISNCGSYLHITRDCHDLFTAVQRSYEDCRCYSSVCSGAPPYIQRLTLAQLFLSKVDVSLFWHRGSSSVIMCAAVRFPPNFVPSCLFLLVKLSYDYQNIGRLTAIEWWDSTNSSSMWRLPGCYLFWKWEL